MMTNNDPIAKALDLVPLIPEKPLIKPIEDNSEYKATKTNMEEILQLGQQAVGELFELAKLSQDFRAYRVLTELISAMTNANKDLMEMKKIDVQTKHLESDDINDSQKTINNNLFVGSTAELSKILEQIKK